MTRYRALNADILRRQVQYDIVEQTRKQVEDLTTTASTIWQQVWRPIAEQIGSLQNTLTQPPR